jgi:creatinine amidohydrolase/Fe(II)-dependent formamide hydrolase-like protein
LINERLVDESTLVEMASPLRLKELVPARVAAAIARDPRLIVPIGTCDPMGPHLPVGGKSIYIDRLADDLSAEFEVLRAPTVEYGVSAEATYDEARAGSVRKKTLHLLLNDLLASWEGIGIREFILLTASDDDAHHEALATVMTLEARVRVIDVSAADASDNTSLMLYLAPHLVDLRLREQDTPDDGMRRPSPGGREARERPLAPARDPEEASAEKGEALYSHVLRRLAERILVQSFA